MAMPIQNGQLSPASITSTHQSASAKAGTTTGLDSKAARNLNATIAGDSSCSELQRQKVNKLGISQQNIMLWRLARARDSVAPALTTDDEKDLEKMMDRDIQFGHVPSGVWRTT